MHKKLIKDLKKGDHVYHFEGLHIGLTIERDTIREYEIINIKHFDNFTAIKLKGFYQKTGYKSSFCGFNKGECLIGELDAKVYVNEITCMRETLKLMKSFAFDEIKEFSNSVKKYILL